MLTSWKLINLFLNGYSTACHMNTPVVEWADYYDLVIIKIC